MIGLVLVSHGELAKALVETASEIVGSFPSTKVLAVTRQQRTTVVKASIRKAVESVDNGRGVLVLADMFGGTAANVALELVGEVNIEVVTGMSLPMLLKVSTDRNTATDLAAFARMVKFYGQRNVMVASEVLKEREQDV